MEIQNKMQKAIDLLNEIDNFIHEHNLENEQFFLDWQDQINEISVR